MDGERNALIRKIREYVPFAAPLHSEAGSFRNSKFVFSDVFGINIKEMFTVVYAIIDK